MYRGLWPAALLKEELGEWEVALAQVVLVDWVGVQALAEWVEELACQGNHHPQSSWFPRTSCTTLQIHHLGILHSWKHRPTCSNSIFCWLLAQELELVVLAQLELVMVPVLGKPCKRSRSRS